MACGCALDLAYNENMTHQNAALRRQMIGSLTEEDLRGLCFDYFPNIYDELTIGMTMSRMVELLLTWCLKNGRFRDLQVSLHRINPHAFPYVYLVESQPVDQPTYASSPPFSHNKIPITKIEIEVRHIQEKVNDLFSPLWQIVITVLIALVILFLLSSQLSNLAKLPALRSMLAMQNNKGQSPPIPTLAVTQTATPLQVVQDLPRPPGNPILFDTWLRSQDNMQMVYVPGDQNLGGFWLDQTEVNNQQYDRCVAIGQCATSALADIADYHKPDYPVVGVSWFDATAYCEWVDGQLPTEAQWDYAVGGSENATYPWGADEPTCDLAQYNVCQIGLAPIGSKPAGKSWVGAFDLAGNVWEWVQEDVVETAVGSAHPLAEPQLQPLRGGGWNADSHQLLNNIRKFENPNNWLDSLGFRCVIPDFSS